MAELPAVWERRVDELLAYLNEVAPMTDEDYRQGAVIFASARPVATRNAA
jgi:hypothetical protein